MGTVKLGQSIEIKEEVIKKVCPLAMKAHKSPEKPYLVEKIKTSSSSSSEVVFSFPGSWSVNDWFTRSSFGETKVDLHLFPSLKCIGLAQTAAVNEAFFKRFKAVLDNPQFKNEVGKAVTERKQVVFTGHSSGGAVAILATIWYLEMYARPEPNAKAVAPLCLTFGAQVRAEPNAMVVAPLCLTFGAPLVGDHIMSHALRRENWSRYFVNFVMRYDIVPRISLAPPSSIEPQMQRVLDFFNPKSQLHKQEPANEATGLHAAVMRSAFSVASYAACKMMGSMNPLLETVTSFIELSPYRPLGTYVFCTENRKLVVISNPDAVLQVLFYSSQLKTPEEILAVAPRSLTDHLNYRVELQENLQTQTVTCLDRLHLERIPLSSNDADVECVKVDAALNALGLNERARLCLRAAGDLEKRKLENKKTIDEKQKEIEKGLDKLEAYKSKCALKQGYYDAFKISDEKADFYANVDRLEQAGKWDEIIEMLKRWELPDDFEVEKAWIKLGTRYRCVVEPLDIANYYRHLKNEDTGPYMGKGRPKRYKCTQRWREHYLRIPNEDLPGSCFWAQVEELCINASGASIGENIRLLKDKVGTWIKDGELGEDVGLENSTFKKLCNEHFPF